ncbi:MAG: YrdB family protein [Mycobacteriales bacterium]
MTPGSGPGHADTEWTPVRVANAGLAFALEMGMLVAFGYWGWQTGRSTAARAALAISAPLLAGIVWGLFLAAGGPKIALPITQRVAIKLAVFAAAAAALAAAGRPLLALAFALASAVSVAVEYLR